MRNATALLALVLAPLAACSHNTTRLGRNVVGGHPVVGDLALNVEKTGAADSARYELFVHWTSDFFSLDIKEGQSLTVTADREQMSFSASKKDILQNYDCENPRCTYDERAYYPVSASQLRKIADAHNVTVEVTGHQRSITRDFNDINFDKFRDFVARNVPQASALGR
jgi:hypothetical protein